MRQGCKHSRKELHPKTLSLSLVQRIDENQNPAVVSLRGGLQGAKKLVARAVQPEQPNHLRPRFVVLEDLAVKNYSWSGFVGLAPGHVTEQVRLALTGSPDKQAGRTI
jgi:hypothetical protein